MVMLCGGFLGLLLLMFVLASLVTWAATTLSPIAETADEEVLD